MAGPWDSPPTEAEKQAAGWDTPPTPEEMGGAPATPAPAPKTGALRAARLGQERGLVALPGLVGLDRARLAAASKWLYDRTLGDTARGERSEVIDDTPSFSDFEAAERREESKAEADQPLATGAGIGIGAAPAMVAGPSAAGATLPARATAAGLQSAAVEGGVTAGLPVEERLGRMGVAGTLGALTPGAAQVTPGASLPAVPSKVSDWLARRAESAAIRSTGADRTAIKRTLLREGGEDRAHAVGRFMLDEPGMRLRSPSTLADDAGEILAQEGPAIGALTKQADAAGATFNVGSFVNRAKQDVVSGLSANPMQKVPGHHGNLVNPAADRLTAFLDDVASRAQNGGITPSEAHVVRQQMDEFLRGVRGAQDPESTVLKSAVNDLRKILNEELGASMDRAGLGSQWKAANQRFSRASDVEKLAQVGAERRGGNAFLSPTEKGGSFLGAGMAVAGEPASGAALALGTIAAKRYGMPVVARTADRLSKALKANPQQFGSHAPGLLAAAERGPEALAAAHYVLSHSSPDYRARFSTVGADEETP